MRIFLTGATGFLGASIARRLVARGHEVAVLVRRESPRLAGVPLTQVTGDLSATDSYRAALAAFAPQALLHCGWGGVAGAARNDLAQLDNIAAAAALFAAAIDSGATRIVGVGSQGEYGPKAGRIAEREPTEPTTLYGIAKVATARTLLTLAALHDVSAAWGRVFSLYGPGDDGDWLIPSLIRAFRQGRTPQLTRCEQVWEYLHVDDAADAFVALVETPDATGLFNVGSGAPAPLRDIVLMLRDMAAPDIAPDFGALPYRPDQVMHLEADIERIAQATGWRPRIALKQGLADTLASFAQERAAA